MSRLILDSVGVTFGGLRALTEVSFTLEPGQVLGLIGPNGAGKTTVFNVITGVYTTSGGTVSYEDAPILGLRPYQILERGIARTFQNIRLFQYMTVLENTMVAQHSRSSSGVFGSMLRTRAQRAEQARVADKAHAELEFMGMDHLADEVAANLPYGWQRRLEIARALASEPKTILLDEPAAGLNPAESAELVDYIRQITDRGINVLMVEHDMKVIMNICDRIVVLDHGVKIAEGEPREIQKHPEVVKAYLGTA